MDQTLQLDAVLSQTLHERAVREGRSLDEVINELVAQQAFAAAVAIGLVDPLPAKTHYH